MPRRFVTKTDIDVCADSGEDVIVTDDLVTVTDAALVHARDRVCGSNAPTPLRLALSGSVTSHRRPPRSEPRSSPA